MMKNDEKITGTVEAWESGALGTDPAHAKPVSRETHEQIDAAMGLQMISIRLPKGVIETFKLLAKMHGVGYQPLMRDALCRFAESEMKQVLIAAVEEQRENAAQPSVEAEDIVLPKAA